MSFSLLKDVVVRRTVRENFTTMRRECFTSIGAGQYIWREDLWHKLLKDVERYGLEVGFCFWKKSSVYPCRAMKYYVPNFWRHEYECMIAQTFPNSNFYL